MRIIREAIDERDGDRLWFLALESLNAASKSFFVKGTDLRTVYSDSACGLDRLQTQK